MTKCSVCGDKGCVWCWKAFADAPSFNETREWTFPNGHKLKFGPDDGEPYWGSLHAKIGWVPELAEHQVEPDYEALGYPETEALVYEHDRDMSTVLWNYAEGLWFNTYIPRWTDPWLLISEMHAPSD